jgi:hypothetical protein
MGYLADLAAEQGSTDMEYTDVHGVCDIAHTQALLTALSAEMAVNPLDPGKAFTSEFTFSVIWFRPSSSARNHPCPVSPL